MKVLVACEFSGVVRDAFRTRGHDAWSCDLADGEGDTTYHIKDDIFNVLHATIQANHVEWDLMIAHPPCTYLCGLGLHWNKRDPERAAETQKAIAFFLALAHQPIPRIAIENPVGIMSTAWRKPDQYIQPYQFGHDASKRTGLWLKHLPPLLLDPELYVEPRYIDGKPRWGNQTDSGQNKLGPSPTRSADRARTYEGIARAMAEQWSLDETIG